MEKFEIDILKDCIRILKIVEEKIENVNDKKSNSLNRAISYIDESILHIENEIFIIPEK